MTEKRILFPQVKGMIHGGDYNPDQWLDRPDILEEDIRLMKKAGINSATLGVFAWSAYEPTEGDFHFEWLIDIMNKLYENGIYTILATPTGARPAWLDAAYPEAMRTAKNGVRNRHGLRHNHCLTSPAFRNKAGILITKLAEAVKDHPGLILWHISNELGGECYCELCQQKFRDYLGDRFDHDINKLNQAWWSSFWSHTLNSFDQIEAPLSNGEGSVLGMNLAWKEFTTENFVDYVRFEKKILNRITPAVPVTTNFMCLYPGIDYYKLREEMDVICWDSYMRFHNDYESFNDTASYGAFNHAVMRSMLKDRPFMLMESTPSLVNWHPFNKLKRPGVHRFASLQAVANGSDTVQYFQWRKGRGSYEQFHGAVVDHLGTDDTRVFREVAEVGEILKKLEPAAGSLIHADAAVLFDWSNRWAIENMAGMANDTKKYELTVQRQYEAFRRYGVETDIVSPLDDLSSYKIVAAPMLYLLKPGMAENLKKYVENGGILVATYPMGYVDQDTLCYLGGFPGDGLKDLFGIISEELDTLYLSDRNGIRFEDGSVFEVKDYCEILRVQDAEVKAVYTDDFYRETPAVTCRRCGKGQAWYVAARMTDGMDHLYKTLLEEAGICAEEQKTEIEFHRRSAGSTVFDFYLNQSSEPVEIVVRQAGRDLITGTNKEGSMILEGYGLAVIQTELSE